MQVGRRWRVGHVAMARCYGVRRLGEEEGRLAIRIMAHFAGVRRIVAADAEDAADREGPAADDRDGRRRPERNGEGRPRNLFEIGRASCRERVCLYWSSSWAAVYLKKKQNIMKRIKHN